MEVKFNCLEAKVVPIDMVQANNYNPNHCSKDKMELLKQSIIDNGLTYAVTVIWSEEDEKYIIVDGFHRYTVVKDYLHMKEIPVVVLDHNISQRMAATIQFNKARGVHAVDGDAEIVRNLIEQGWSEEEISKHLGIDMETVLRYKQLTGIVELFKNVEYSKSWEVGEFDGEDEKENI